ncbi:SAF domain-containing protein [Paenibacillus sp. JX-17]|uniref:SAF domain-containing protein n=1 Tax=Paenibacillus lacisoli TaxID=3064525 RepID=A0ABT9C6P1_9BACL|nr:SAF domain-containing protein [Paenibacillus sp. JX-17]MDO7904925.1 SAF domain-containing protein [Paenibacillus sp. JX-17]
MFKLRKKSRQLLLAGSVGAGVVGLIFIIYVFYSHVQLRTVRQQASDQVTQFKQEVQKQSVQDQQQIAAYVLIRDIAAGVTIKAEDLQLRHIPAGIAPANVISDRSKPAGKTVKIPLQKSTVLTTGMLNDQSPVSHDLRHRQFGAALLPSNLKTGDVVDLRIQFPSGQDFIILAKKKINILSAPNIWFTLTEQEILTLSSAIVDAYLHKASIYALTYVEPEFQKEAIPTYPANHDVIKLMAGDPNIVQQAERALATSMRNTLEKSLVSSNNNNLISSDSILSSDRPVSRGLEAEIHNEERMSASGSASVSPLEPVVSSEMNESTVKETNGQPADLQEQNEILRNGTSSSGTEDSF